MGLRCLVGHDYGEPQTERDRTEQGGEVVVTVREYKECTQCGQRQVVSEHTEATSVASTSEPESAHEEPFQDEEPTTDKSDDLSADEDDGVILDDEPENEREHGEWPNADDEGDDHVGPTGIRSASTAPDLTQRHNPRTAEIEFVCPECGHTTPADDSSLRPGDICPECHRSYITERMQSDET